MENLGAAEEARDFCCCLGESSNRLCDEEKKEDFRAKRSHGRRRPTLPFGAANGDGGARWLLVEGACNCRAIFYLG